MKGIKIFLLTVVFCLLASCGQKGPLYLPLPPTPNQGLHK